MNKKIIALTLGLTVTMGALSGCGVNVANMGTANGEDIDTDLFNFYVESELYTFNQENALADYAAFEAFELDGKKASEIVVDRAYEKVARDALVKTLCAENKVSPTAEEVSGIKGLLEQQYAQWGLDLASAAEMFGMSEGLLIALNTTGLYENNLQEALYPMGEVTPLSDQEMKSTFDTDYVRAKHILFKTTDDSNQPLTDAQITEKRDLAEQTLAKIQNGEDFESFMDLSEDPGSVSQPDGYVFTHGEMVAPFEEAAFALKDGEVSEIVESDFGYHIIKRYDKNEKPEFLEAAKETMLSAYTQSKQEEMYTAASEELNAFLETKIGDVEIKRDEKKVKKIDFKKMMTPAEPEPTVEPTQETAPTDEAQK